MRNIGVSFKGYNIFCDGLDTLSFSGKTAINTINQYSYCIAERDPVFKKALLNSDVLLPDGVGIVLAVKAILNRNIKKISGAELHRFLLTKLNANNGKCFYLGSSEKTLEKIDAHLVSEYPHVIASYHSPPFKDEFSELENMEMIEKINRYKPDVLFVGMTAPKQEKWVDSYKHLLDVNIVCSIGAVFDFYAGTVKRPDDIWINMGLEWFIRLCKEPKRMWKRYIWYGPIFMFDVLKEVVKVDIRTILPNKKNVL